MFNSGSVWSSRVCYRKPSHTQQEDNTKSLIWESEDLLWVSPVLSCDGWFYGLTYFGVLVYKWGMSCDF